MNMEKYTALNTYLISVISYIIKYHHQSILIKSKKCSSHLLKAQVYALYQQESSSDEEQRVWIETTAFSTRCSTAVILITSRMSFH